MPCINYQPDPRYIKALAERFPYMTLRLKRSHHERRAWQWLPVLMMLLVAGLVWTFTHRSLQGSNEQALYALAIFSPGAIVSLVVTYHFAKSEQYELAAALKSS